MSGLEVYIQNLTVEMIDDFDITVFSRKRYCDVILQDYKGVKVRYVPSINTKHLDAITYSVIATVLALIGHYDIFWYQALGPAVTMPLTKLFKKKIVSTVHGLDWKRDKFGKVASAVLKLGERCIANNADIIITLQKFDDGYFRKKWNKNTILIPNGVRQPCFRDAMEITNKYGLKTGSYILFMSRIVPEKGVHILVKAYQRSGIDKKLVIAGRGVHTAGYEDDIRKMAQNDENIIFTGLVDGALKEELYSNAYAYVLPSTIEGQSIGLLEAMSYGLACIVSDIPENIDVVRDAGIHFEVDNVESLKLALIDCANNKEKIVSIGKEAQKQICDNHNWNNTLAQTVDTFKTLL